MFSPESPSHPFSCPWWGWEAYAGVSCLIYLTAIWGMTGLNNNYAAAGWAVTSLHCFLWFLYFRNERRATPLRCPLRSDDTTPRGMHTAQLDAPLTASYPTRVPFYCTLASISLMGCISAALVLMALVFLSLSITHHAPLTGSSTWMAFISWSMAVKCSLQLLASLYRGRQRWLEAIQEGQLHEARKQLPELHHVM